MISEIKRFVASYGTTSQSSYPQLVDDCSCISYHRL